MTRRFNFTGRHRITSDHFSARVISETPLVASLKMDISDLKLEGSNRIVIEPYAGTVSKRVDCGTVSAPNVPEQQDLSELQSGASIQFRVKVTDKDGRLTASADRIHLVGQNEEANRRSLLPVETTPTLGEEVWRIRVSESLRPTLQLNSRLPSIERRLVEDPVLAASILAPAVRRVLDVLSQSPSGDDWKDDWLQFARKWRPDATADTLPDDGDEREEWIDDVVSGFLQEQAFVRRAAELLQGGAKK